MMTRLMAARAESTEINHSVELSGSGPKLVTWKSAIGSPSAALVTLQEATGPAGLMIIGLDGLPVMVEYLLFPEPTIPEVVIPAGLSTVGLDVDGRPFRTGKLPQFRLPVKRAQTSRGGVLISILGERGEWLSHGNHLGFLVCERFVQSIWIAFPKYLEASGSSSPQL